MAKITPFRALRPNPELASEICELPYDVLSVREAREVAERRPRSFFWISKPEIGWAEGETAPSREEIYARGRKQFDRLIREEVLFSDRKACFYLYRQIMGAHEQIGLVALSSCREYESGVIRKHEFTRPDKEDDRVSHMESLEAQTGAVFLTYPADHELDRKFSAAVSRPAQVDFTSEDGVRHSAWVIAEEEELRFIEERFAGIPRLYIADGHHRSAAASRVVKDRAGKNGSGGFLTVLIPHDQVTILPYNRFVHDLAGQDNLTFLARLSEVAAVEIEAETVEPRTREEVGMYLNRQWYRLNLTSPNSPRKLEEQLTVTRLQRQVLGPILDIGDPRQSRRISFVGGIRGARELEKLVDRANQGVAFSLYPTQIDELLEVADSGGVMPPKSTWFEPKLRDGMFCHLLR